MCGHHHPAASQPRSEHSCCAGNAKRQGAAPAEGRPVAVTKQPSGLSYWRRLLRKIWAPDREPASRRA
jgi:hypothetical protein